MPQRLWIMVAGPYRTGARTHAERAANLRTLNRAAYEVFKRGHLPLVGVNAALPVIEAGGPDTYESVMMPLSLALAERCDGILRVGGASPGADAEVEIVRKAGGRGFGSLADIPSGAPS
jgi:hypothetical protein